MLGKTDGRQENHHIVQTLRWPVTTGHAQLCRIHNSALRLDVTVDLGALGGLETPTF
jgi:hypothetical protein